MIGIQYGIPIHETPFAGVAGDPRKTHEIEGLANTGKTAVQHGRWVSDDPDKEGHVPP